MNMIVIRNTYVDHPCACSACTGCPLPPPPDSDELAGPDDDPDGVLCQRCGRYVWSDSGNERLRCPATGEWLCPLCSNVERPYPFNAALKGADKGGIP